MFLGGIARISKSTSRAAVNRGVMGRGINGGDPRFAGRSPFMPRKPVADRLISEHGVVNFRPSVIPPSLFGLRCRVDS
jgi:hypothetical protein